MSFSANVFPFWFLHSIGRCHFSGLGGAHASRAYFFLIFSNNFFFGGLHSPSLEIGQKMRRLVGTTSKCSWWTRILVLSPARREMVSSDFQSWCQKWVCLVCASVRAGVLRGVPTGVLWVFWIPRIPWAPWVLWILWVLWVGFLRFVFS